jgi:adenylate cyclase
VAATRRLAAIMFTDTVGYTASTQSDEGRTLDLLRQQEELIRPLLAVHQGKEIKSTGDGFLVEFDSALKAIQCALSIQRRIYERNAEGGLVPIRIRIGIHLGDVVQRGSDILGDAVNIAARIEPIAEPGGICVSGAVHEQVRNKIPDRLEKLPPTSLKGLDAPMDIYRVVLPWLAREPPPAVLGSTGIAVLPFANISPDPKDEYFADGLTEELISRISRLAGFRVISRTSVQQYKATTKSMPQIGSELAVKSILEGSVRKAGNKLRITTQLIDAGLDRHLWAETYDRDLDDIFAVQSEIAREVAQALEVELGTAEENALSSAYRVRPESYLAYLQGLAQLRVGGQVGLQEAKKLFGRAISLDGRNAAAYASLAYAEYYHGIWFGDASDRSWLETSRREAERAIEIDPNLPEPHHTIAEFLWADWQYDATETELKRALELNPSFSRAHHSYGVVLEELLRTDEALVEFALAEAADPLWDAPIIQQAWLMIWLGRYNNALQKIDQLVRMNPSPESRDFPHAMLAIYNLARGNLNEFRKEAAWFERTTVLPGMKEIVQAWVLAIFGEKEAARAILRQDPKWPDLGQNAHFMAWVYAELGDLDECFRLLELSVERQNLPVHQWRLDPRFAQVRSDPRFQVLLKKMNLA